MWEAFQTTCVPFLCFRFSLRLNVSRPRFGLLQLLNMCSSSERSASVARVFCSSRCFCQGQDLFLEGPLGASLCATSLCSLLCVHSSSSALARGNGQQLGVRRFRSFTQSHHDIIILLIITEQNYKNHPFLWKCIRRIRFSLSKLECLRILFWRLRLRLLKSHGSSTPRLRGQGFTGITDQTF